MEVVLDVRGMRKPDKHPTIIERYESLDVGESFILVNDHDPKHLHDEFERDRPGAYGWEYVRQESRDWRIRIVRRTSTALPRILIDTDEIADDDTGTAGAAWSIAVNPRDLDSNIIALPPGDTIAPHVGPDFDVLAHILRGGGTLTTELGDVPLTTGALAFLPRRSLRGFTAGPDGLRYLTVHRKRPPLGLTPAPAHSPSISE